MIEAMAAAIVEMEMEDGTKRERETPNKAVDGQDNEDKTDDMQGQLDEETGQNYLQEEVELGDSATSCITAVVGKEARGD
jgi:hypothetical protein